MKKLLEMILTTEELSRITENEKSLTVDLHGLKVRDAKKLLKNIMAINREGMDIAVIHGYVHGTAIKEMITNDLKNPRLVKKAGVKRNYGKTVLKMRAA